MEKNPGDSVDKNKSGVGGRIRLRRDDDNFGEVGESGVISVVNQHEF